MPRTDYDQVIGPDGTVLSETVVIRPVQVITPEQLQQAKQTVRAMIGTFFPGGVPTGEPSPAQMRNWLIALSVGLRWAIGEMDDET